MDNKRFLSIHKIQMLSYLDHKNGRTTTFRQNIILAMYVS